MNDMQRILHADIGHALARCDRRPDLRPTRIRFPARRAVSRPRKCQTGGEAAKVRRIRWGCAAAKGDCTVLPMVMIARLPQPMRIFLQSACFRVARRTDALPAGREDRLGAWVSTREQSQTGSSAISSLHLVRAARDSMLRCPHFPAALTVIPVLELLAWIRPRSEQYGTSRNESLTMLPCAARHLRRSW
jgi:hypothetical protein